MTDHAEFTHLDMDRWLTERNVTEIECLVPDLTGVARGKILPREKFTTERAMRLPEAVLGVTVTGESPEGHDGYDRVMGLPIKTWCCCLTRRH
jgi:glutamine synthetase